MNRKLLVAVLFCLLAVGGFSASIFASGETTGTVTAVATACADASVPDRTYTTADQVVTGPSHALSRDGAPLANEPGDVVTAPGQTVTSPGASDHECQTSTQVESYTIPTVTQTVTTGGGGDYPASFFSGPAGYGNALPPAGKAFFGVTPPNNTCGANGLQVCTTWQENLDAFHLVEGQVGRQFTLISDFQQQRCSLDMTRLNGMRAEAPMQLSWEPSPNHDDQVIAGQADSCIQAVGAQLGTITDGNKVIVRLYHEANGNWMSWSKNSNGSLATAAQFKAMFQRTVDQLRIGGAFVHGMVSIELNWSEGYFGNGDYFDEIAAYPGDSYVDWVSSDGYATGSPEWCGGGTQHICELAEQLTHGKCVTPPVPELQQTGFLCNATRVPIGTEVTYRGVKPYMIAETGRGENTPAPQGSWMRYAGNYIVQRMPGTYGVAYFDQDARTWGETQNWRVDTNAAKLQGFKDWALMPRFLGP